MGYRTNSRGRCRRAIDTLTKFKTALNVTAKGSREFRIAECLEQERQAVSTRIQFLAEVDYGDGGWAALGPGGDVRQMIQQRGGMAINLLGDRQRWVFPCSINPPPPPPPPPTHPTERSSVLSTYTGHVCAGGLANLNRNKFDPNVWPASKEERARPRAP